MFKGYLEDGVDLHENLALIKAGKVDEWLNQCKQKYTCKFCSKPTATGAKQCHHCKKEI